MRKPPKFTFLLFSAMLAAVLGMLAVFYWKYESELLF